MTLTCQFFVYASVESSTHCRWCRSRASLADVNAGPLRQAILAAKGKGSLDDLTVLSVQNDPFRLDTEANHSRGAWLASALEELQVPKGTHLRGIHYAIAMAPGGRQKPNGERYLNNESDWIWLAGTFKAARWLEYVDFEDFDDNRNSQPELRLWTPSGPRPKIDFGVDFEIPAVVNVEPKISLLDFRGVQPYKLVFIGEKSSLDPVLSPLAGRYQADLYLPTGEISDTQIHRMATVMDKDGRPAVIFYFSDCDPSGWQMPISVSRKMQAFKELKFPSLEFETHHVAIKPELVHEHGLPSAPLKESELRAENWKAKMGVEQTEVDALLTPQNMPILRQLVHDAVKPFFDKTLAERVRDAEEAWTEEAQEIINSQVDQDRISQIQQIAEQKKDQFENDMRQINDDLWHIIGTTGDYDLPEIEVPEAELTDEPNEPPLIDSHWDFGMQTALLKLNKEYNVNTINALHQALKGKL